jgi:hypothetical protein
MAAGLQRALWEGRYGDYIAAILGKSEKHRGVASWEKYKSLK